MGGPQRQLAEARGGSRAVLLTSETDVLRRRLETALSEGILAFWRPREDGTPGMLLSQQSDDLCDFQSVRRFRDPAAAAETSTSPWECIVPSGIVVRTSRLEWGLLAFWL